MEWYWYLIIGIYVAVIIMFIATTLGSVPIELLRPKWTDFLVLLLWPILWPLDILRDWIKG